MHFNRLISKSCDALEDDVVLPGDLVYHVSESPCHSDLDEESQSDGATIEDYQEHLVVHESSHENAKNRIMRSHETRYIATYTCSILTDER